MLLILITAMSEVLNTMVVSKYADPTYFYDLTSLSKKRTFSEVLFDSVASNSLCLNSGFIIGILLTLRNTGIKKNNNFIANPLKIIFDASINGFLSLFIVRLLIAIIPKKFRIIVPLTTLGTCIYLKMHKSCNNDK
jgi:ABC-type methionine transport system permease subunit